MNATTRAARLRGRLVAAALAACAALPLAVQAQGGQCPPEARIQSMAQSVNEGLAVTPMGNSSKPNNATFLWEQVSGPGPVTFLPSATAANVSFVAPQVTGDQQVTIRLTVFGCSGLSHSTTGTVTIRDTTAPPPNRAPTAIAQATPPIAGAGVTVTLDGSGSTDPDNQPLAYSWAQIDGPAVALAGADAAQATFVAPNLTAGATLGFRLTVTDPGNLQSQADVVVNVPFDNDSPLARLACPELVQEGQSVTLDASASTDFEDDASNTALAYEWSQLEGPPNLPVALEHGSSVTFVAPVLTEGQEGGIRFQVTVTDSGGLYDTAECSLMIEDVTAPVFSGDDDRIEEATGPDGALVFYGGLSATDNVEGDVTADIACVPPPGSLFALDEPATVQCAVADLNGNGSETSFQVVVRDRTKPVIAAHGDVAVEATGPAGAVVEYEAPETFDVVDVDLVATCTPPAGSTFALGTHVVTCTAADASGNAAVPTTFGVTVHDTTPPSVSVPAPITAEATSPQGAPVAFAASAEDLVDGTVAPVCTAGGDVVASGDVFPLGASTVACTATDQAGNSGSASFTVTVVDTTPPVLSLPADISAEATSPGGAAVAFAATADDLVSGNVPVTCLPASGSTFALGTTTVECSAADAASNTSQGAFTVTVRDTTPPTLHLPPGITAEATSAAGAVVAYVATAEDLVDTSVAVACTPASGSTFALGATTVSCTGTDDAGNTATGTFEVGVVDTTPPAFAPHADVEAIAPSDSRAVVHYTDPAATDLVDGTVDVACTPASGSTFPVGSTPITCTATDRAGNTASSGFHVNVRYAFSGFFRPVDNLPTLNVVKAGQAIPVKFSLGGNQGLAIFASGHPRAVAMSCTGATQDTVEETVTAGGSSLQYDATSGQYIYVWKSDKGWAGTCRQLQVKFADGSTQAVANFGFTR